ncbi:MAG TPA: metallophosphoesterase, partial [Candidatus Omnitrophota bacterium]|nr:metallophosphoesterase [Candidatus Omnitrophota bacterium]
MLIREYVSLTLFLCVVLAIYIKEASLILKLVFHKLGRRQGPSGFLSKPAVAVHIVSFIGILCILYAMFIEPQWIEVKRVELTTPKLSKTRMRIVQISDTHCDPEGGGEMKAVAIINSLKPDVVVFTGDALNTEKAMPVFKAAMKAIDAPWKFAVTGNFDYWFMRGKDLFGGTG